MITIRHTREKIGDRVRAILIAAGLVLPTPAMPGQLSPEEREKLAERIPPLSQAIIEERKTNYEPTARTPDPH